MKNLKAVLLDAEGTFIHIHPSVGDVYAYVLSQYGLQCSPDKINKAFFTIWNRAKTKRKKEISRDTNYLFWKEIFLETIAGSVELQDPETIFKDCYQEFSKKRWWKLAEGIVETLKKWKSDGLLIGIVSNWDERLFDLLDEFDIKEYFDTVTISTEVGLEKPDPKIVELACSNLGVAPSQAVMIGDSLELDHPAALAAGCSSILYDPRGNIPNNYCRIKDFNAVGDKEKLIKVISGTS